jgi:hypothetical protein
MIQNNVKKSVLSVLIIVMGATLSTSCLDTTHIDVEQDKEIIRLREQLDDLKKAFEIRGQSMKMLADEIGNMKRQYNRNIENLEERIGEQERIMIGLANLKNKDGSYFLPIESK